MAYEKLRITHLQCSKQARCDPVITKSRKKERAKKRCETEYNAVSAERQCDIYSAFIQECDMNDNNHRYRILKEMAETQARQVHIDSRTLVFIPSFKSVKDVPRKREGTENTHAAHKLIWASCCCVHPTQRTTLFKLNILHIDIGVDIAPNLQPGWSFMMNQKQKKEKLKKKNSSNEKKNNEQKRNREIPSEIVYTIFSFGWWSIVLHYSYGSIE